jgi:hypothetical protein
LRPCSPKRSPAGGTSAFSRTRYHEPWFATRRFARRQLFQVIHPFSSKIGATCSRTTRRTIIENREFDDVL